MRDVLAAPLSCAAADAAGERERGGETAACIAMM